MSSIEELKFDKKNFNKHTEYGMSLLEKSLREFGAGRSVLVDKDDNIIAGNGIVESAANAGITRTRVVETTGDELVVVKRIDVVLDSKKGRRMAFADNATASADLEWDNENVKSELTKDDTDDWGVDIDWDEPEEVVEDEAPEVDETTADSELGKVYQLGRHRLMCGDSTNAEQVAILMDGKKADMVFTDPPYGMNLDTDFSSMHSRLNTDFANRHMKGGKYDSVIGDKSDFSPALINTVFDNFADTEEVFIWGADYYAEIIPKRNEGSWYVWDKRQNELDNIELAEAMDRGYGSCFELCWSKNRHKRQLVRIKWAGLFGMEKDDTKKRVHPTQKPAILAQWFIDKYSKVGDSVVDIYGGSGSTLIACEQLGRTCYMMELDPHYCDVIRKRYWKLTTGSEEGWQEGTKAQ